jgi:hypothetical protein
MMHLIVLLACAVSAAVAQNQPIPEKGADGTATGVFGGGMGGMPNCKENSTPHLKRDPLTNETALPGGGGALGGLLAGFAGKAAPNGLISTGNIQGGAGKEYPQGPQSKEDLSHPGTGPYPAHIFTDPTLINTTLFAPKIVPPPSVKLPVIVFGEEGGCLPRGMMYPSFLMEIASHGYFVLATSPMGPPIVSVSGYVHISQVVIGASREGQTKVEDLKAAIDLESKGSAGMKYGNIDTTKIATMGQSCGGIQALSAAYHDDRVKLTVL